MGLMEARMVSRKSAAAIRSKLPMFEPSQRIRFAMPKNGVVKVTKINRGNVCYAIVCDQPDSPFVSEHVVVRAPDTDTFR